MITNVAFSSQAGNGLSFFQRFTPAVVSLVFIVGTVIFFFMFVMGAIAWVSSSGDKQSLEGARTKITNALVGIVILFSLYAILNFTGKFFKSDVTSITIKSLFAPANSGGSTGGTGGTGTGVAACSGCINGGCGISGQVYRGTGTDNYLCDASGWHLRNDLQVTTQTCGTCN